jgi:secreted PhoX family phosphatase
MTDSPRSPSRRAFLRHASTAAGFAALSPFAALALRPVVGAPQNQPMGSPLQLMADATSGLELISLPPGFRYLTMGWAGQALSDGTPTPIRHDGMSVVSEDSDGLYLIRNHEIWNDAGSFGPADLTYDPAGSGGTTTLHFDPDRGELLGSWLSLAGTYGNCAGGRTPWGTWLSCEETVMGPGEPVGNAPDSRLTYLQEDHGFVFEVPPEGAHTPEPLRDMGRFEHEAAAVDPETGIVYLTEDRWRAGFYRFLPEVAGELAAGGRLQMAKVVGQPDMTGTFAPGATFDVEWVDIDDPERAHRPDTMDTQGVFGQGEVQGGSAFARLEGCWFEGRAVNLSSTSGGLVRAGQIWRFHPDEQTIQLLFESPSEMVLGHPDNICATPGGGLLLCEDGSRHGMLIHGLRADGTLVRVARNDVLLPSATGIEYQDFRGSEWAGACFSPDGRWLFVNLQKPGITFAITGPWAELGL